MGVDYNLLRWRRNYIRFFFWWFRVKEDSGFSYKWNLKRRNGFDNETFGVFFRLESRKEGDSSFFKIEVSYSINFKWEVINK